MKKLLISSLLLIFSAGIYSQSKEECFSNLSIFAEYAKVKNYDDAYQPWLKVKAQCPDLNSAIYIYGERLLKNFIKKSEGDDKDKYQVDLLNLYSEWLKYFPKSKRGKNEIGKILAIKAQSMIDYKLADDQAIYNVYDEAFNKDSNSFKSPKGLYNYFKIYFKLYKEDSSMLV